MANYKDRTNAALNISLRRQYSHPLDVSVLFENMNDFEAYVTQNVSYSPVGYDEEDISFLRSINPYSYAGQIVSVLQEDDLPKVFVIDSVGVAGTYHEVGAGSLADAIITVEGQLPTEDIQDNLIYRLVTTSRVAYYIHYTDSNAWKEILSESTEKLNLLYYIANNISLEKLQLLKQFLDDLQLNNS